MRSDLVGGEVEVHAAGAEDDAGVEVQARAQAQRARHPGRLQQRVQLRLPPAGRRPARKCAERPGKTRETDRGAEGRAKARKGRPLRCGSGDCSGSLPTGRRAAPRAFARRTERLRRWP